MQPHSRSKYLRASCSEVQCHGESLLTRTQDSATFHCVQVFPGDTLCTFGEGITRIRDFHVFSDFFCLGASSR